MFMVAGGNMNIKVLVALTLGLTAGVVEANDSFNSELSHFAGGAAMGAGFTVISDHYWSQENRGWVGFGVGAGIGVLGEAVQLASGDKFSALDATANALGAAVGAYATDQWFLMPVASPKSQYVGLYGHYRF
jgi:hypothetical protein